MIRPAASKMRGVIFLAERIAEKDRDQQIGVGVCSPPS
jgi:hypothetical protein